MKELVTKIDINASPSRIWQVLTDFEKHQSWNPFIKKISTLGVGGTERLVAYPVVFWLIVLGEYLIAASSLLVTQPPKGVIQR
jgi:hypothetical protein